jgi:hypothetical protein
MSKLTTLNGLNNDELLDSIFSEEIIGPEGTRF